MEGVSCRRRGAEENGKEDDELDAARHAAGGARRRRSRRERDGVGGRDAGEGHVRIGVSDLRDGGEGEGEEGEGGYEADSVRHGGSVHGVPGIKGE